MPELQVPREISTLVAMKAEAAAGTDVFAGTYVAADVMEAENIQVRLDPNEIENRVLMGNLGRAPSVKGARFGSVSFRQPIRGLVGAAEYDDSPVELVPPADRPLRACRLGRTFTNPGVASSSIKYQPTSAGETFTIYVIYPIPGSANAKAMKFVGCQGTGRITARAGEGAFYDFTFVGALAASADVVFVNGALVLTPAYPTMISAAFQIGSGNYAPVIAAPVFDMGQRVARRPSINALTGADGVFVADRRPTLVIDPEVDLEANFAWDARHQSGSPLDDCTFQLGSVHANRLKFQFAADGSSANLQVVDMQPDVRDEGIRCLRITLLPTIATANSDWSLLYD